jgi:hypothetical protein
MEMIASGNLETHYHCHHHGNTIIHQSPLKQELITAATGIPHE